MELNLRMPRAFDFLWGDQRYIVAHGGRGSGKSVNIAQVLLIKGMQKRHRILCVRELQGSIKESVHQLLKDQIEALGLQDFYKVQENVIRGVNGTEFLFKGLRFSASEIKSMQGVSLVWAEEARVISKTSWDVLIPTIREEGSQFYVSFNAELDDDDTYKRFVLNPPPNAVVRKVNWDANPFFPEVLRIEKEALKAKDYDDYLTVWEGHCRQALEGAVYAREIRAATTEGRICEVPIERAKPMHTFWDLGRGDMTAIWFAQIVGFQYRLPHYYQASGFGLDHYLGVLEDVRKERGFFYGTIWLPHDADHRLLGSRRTVRQQVEDAGYRVRIAPKLPVHEGINAARTLFPNCYFDRENTVDGVNCLRRYAYDVDDDGSRSKNPLHNQYSHGADGFRYMGVALKEDSPKPKKPPVKPKGALGRHGWLAG